MSGQDDDLAAWYRQVAPREIRGKSEGPGEGVMVGRVVTPTASIGVGKYLLVNPVSVYGAEAEGGPGALSVDSTAAIPVYLIGPKPAQQGDLLVCRFIQYRWVAERWSKASTGHTLAGCGCANIPGTIFMHVANPQTQHLTFADYYTYSPVVSSSLRYQLRPMDTVPTGVNIVNYSPAYYSDAKYNAYVYVSAQWVLNGTIRFYMYCDPFSGSYSVGLIYTTDPPQSANGSYYSGVFSGLISFHPGFPGNPCSPFRMTNGVPANNNVRNLGITLGAS